MLLDQLLFREHGEDLEAFNVFLDGLQVAKAQGPADWAHQIHVQLQELPISGLVDAMAGFCVVFRRRQLIHRCFKHLTNKFNFRAFESEYIRSIEFRPWSKQLFQLLLADSLVAAAESVLLIEAEIARNLVRVNGAGKVVQQLLFLIL